MVKPPRSALPLPRYVERKPIKGAGWAHYWHTPKWAKDAGCPIGNEALGLDYAAAVKRAEEVLLPAFDAWRSGDTKTAAMPAVAMVGTLDWLFAEYRADRRYTSSAPRASVTMRSASSYVGGYILKDGKLLARIASPRSTPL